MKRDKIYCDNILWVCAIEYFGEIVSGKWFNDDEIHVII